MATAFVKLGWNHGSVLSSLAVRDGSFLVYIIYIYDR